MCHVNGSEQNLPTGLNAVIDPQGPINPIQPVASACTGCHVTFPTASHALANTTTLGESCTVCHSSGAAFRSARCMRSIEACARLLVAAGGALCMRALPDAPPSRLRRIGSLRDLPRRYLQRLRARVRIMRSRQTRSAAGRASLRILPRARRRSTPNRPRPPIFAIPAKLAAAAADKICLTCHLNQPTHVGRLAEQPRQESGLLHDLPQGSRQWTVRPGGAQAGGDQRAVRELPPECLGAVSKAFHHKLPEGAMTCVDCHNPHGSIRPGDDADLRRQRAGLLQVPWRQARAVHVRARAGAL